MNVSVTPSAKVMELSPDHWLLSISSETNDQYRLAQIDDYQNKPRSAFPWYPPLRLSLKAKSSDQSIPGTWGFGFWNDPFHFSIKLAKARFRLPALPQAIWYFFASPESYLSLDNHSPANGQIVTTYHSMNIHPLIFSPAAILLPLVGLPPFGKAIRKISQYFVKQSGKSIDHDLLKFHNYEIEWKSNVASFYLDGDEIYHTDIVPKSPLGLVIWIDNQYAALPPNGKIRFGTLSIHHPVSIEIQDLKIKTLME